MEEKSTFVFLELAFQDFHVTCTSAVAGMPPAEMQSFTANSKRSLGARIELREVQSVKEAGKAAAAGKSVAAGRAARSCGDGAAAGIVVAAAAWSSRSQWR